MAPGDRIAVPDRIGTLPFPAPPGAVTRIPEEPLTSWVCHNPSCVHCGLERVGV